MISDGLEKHGFQLAALGSGVIDQVAALSPGWMPLSNPLDNRSLAGFTGPIRRRFKSNLNPKTG
jgi:hypothetical protein